MTVQSISAFAPMVSASFRGDATIVNLPSSETAFSLGAATGHLVSTGASLHQTAWRFGEEIVQREGEKKWTGLQVYAFFLRQIEKRFGDDIEGARLPIALVTISSTWLLQWGADDVTIMASFSGSQLAEAIGQKEVLGKLKALPSTTRAQVQSIVELGRAKRSICDLPYLDGDICEFGTRSTVMNYMNMVLQLMKGDHRVLWLVVVEKLQSLIFARSESESRTIVQQLQQIYLPLADRLGFHDVVSDVGNYALIFTQPERYHDIEAAVKHVLGISDYHDVERVVREQKRFFEEEVVGAAGINDPAALVLVGDKKLFSIAEKVDSPRKKHITSIEDITDLLRGTIVTDRPEEALALLQSRFGDRMFFDQVERKNRAEHGYDAIHIEGFDLLWELKIMSHRDHELCAGRMRQSPEEFRRKPALPHWMYKLGSFLDAVNIPIGQRFQLDPVLLGENPIENTRRLYAAYQDDVFVILLEGRRLSVVSLPKGEAKPVHLTYHPDLAIDIHDTTYALSPRAPEALWSEYRGKAISKKNDLITGIVLKRAESRGIDPSRELRNFRGQAKRTPLMASPSLLRSQLPLRFKLDLAIHGAEETEDELRRRGKKRLEEAFGGRIVASEYAMIDAWARHKGWRVERSAGGHYVDRDEVYAATAVGLFDPAEVHSYIYPRDEVILLVSINKKGSHESITKALKKLGGRVISSRFDRQKMHVSTVKLQLRVEIPRAVDNGKIEALGQILDRKPLDQHAFIYPSISIASR